MKYELIKGNASYEVKVVVDAAMETEMKQGALTLAQKDFVFAGFRKGHVPLSIVEKNIKPDYMQMAMYEEVINKTLQQVIKENDKIQFIGQPYDLNDSKVNDVWTITFKLDVYPEVDVKDKKWQSLSIDAINDATTPDEEATALNNLARQYADYQDTDTVTEDSVSKLKFVMKDADGNEIDKGSVFLGKEEYEESALLKKEFVGQKKDATVEFKYDEKKLPHTLHFHPKDEAKKALKAATVSATIVDIKNIILPDFNDTEVLKKLFQSEEITNKASLEKKVHEVLSQQKRENELHKAVEKALDEVQGSMTVSIPHTVLREEMTARVKQLGDRMGGEAGLKQYFDKLGEEGTNKVYNDIEASAKTSLEKFFVLRKLVELLEINDIDWNKHLDAEEKIYAKLSSGSAKPAKAKAAKKEETEETAAEKPAKKTAKAKEESTEAPKKKAPAKKAA